jgi:cytochrome o ubiquinol oxidase subunit 2
MIPKMDKKLKIAFFLLVLFGFVSIGLLFLYSSGIIVLNPQGMIGEKQRDLLLLSTYIMLIVVIPVFILTFWVAWKFRASNKEAKYSPEWDNSHLAEAIWWGVPFVIIIFLGVITWNSCHELDPFKPIQSDVKPLRIQVVALEWKWLFIYPEEKIAAINFLQFPEKTPIEFEITADAPMNSFWIPELGGQIYAMSGMRSKLSLIANGQNTYRGFSAHLSGKGFSGMTFMAKSSTSQEFSQWVESARSSPPLGMEEYQQLVQPSEYVPPATFVLTDPQLFDEVVMKYMSPKSMQESSLSKSRGVHACQD